MTHIYGHRLETGFTGAGGNMRVNVDSVIREKYGIEPDSVSTAADGWDIVLPGGRLKLQKMGISAGRLLFVHEVKEHLARNGFAYIDNHIKSIDGNPYFELEGGIYCLKRTPDGHECRFDKREDSNRAAIALGRMHLASEGFKPGDGALTQSDLGKLPLSLGKRLDDLKKMKKAASKGKGKFDYLFEQNVDMFYNMGKKTLSALDGPLYAGVNAIDAGRGTLCHHDLTYKNIILNDSGEAHIINFNYCCHEIKIYDIANLVRRKMRKCGWDIVEARHLLDAYRSAYDITRDEFTLLRLLLEFPQKFWRVSNRYYNSKRAWSDPVFTAQLVEVEQETERLRAFIEDFESLW
jgi:spore coat protein I